MVLIRHRHRKEPDKRPFKGEFLGRKVIGPLKKNLAIPNELVNTLEMKDRRGRADLKSWKANIG